MNSVNGVLLICLSFFVLWIGVTGRFPKLMEAIGIIRGNLPQTNSQNSVTVPPPTGPYIQLPNFFGK